MTLTEAPTNIKSYESMTTNQLIAELKKRDKRIVELEKQLPDPEIAERAAWKLTQLAITGIKKLIVYKPACKQGKARFTWSSLCDEATFRAFVGLKGAEKTKGQKMKVADFNELTNNSIHKSLRFGSMSIKGEHVNITYLSDGQIRISGSYDETLPLDPKLNILLLSPSPSHCCLPLPYRYYSSQQQYITTIMGRRGGWSYQPGGKKQKKATKRAKSWRSLNPRNWSASRFEEEFPGIFDDMEKSAKANKDKEKISPSDAAELTTLLADDAKPAASPKVSLPSPASTVATAASKTPSPPTYAAARKKVPTPVVTQQGPPRKSNDPNFREEKLGDFERMMREKYGRR